MGPATWRAASAVQENAFLVLWVLSSKLLRPNHLRNWTRDLLYYPAAPDRRFRNEIVAQSIRSILPTGGKVLDVGSGASGLERCLNRPEFRVTNLDLTASRLERFFGLAKGKVVGEALHLPFKTDSFDAVAAVDMIEHTMRADRAKIIKELARVSRMHVILHTPVESTDGRFGGRSDDEWFRRWFHLHFGIDDGNTLEHLRFGEPTLDELLESLPGAQIEPSQPSQLWRAQLQKSRTPLVGIAIGSGLDLERSGGLGNPPYHAALVHWMKH